ncbi:MAG: SDR family NAD(P)-dependent oxidoreductase [Clostridiales bacterium]|nr:SDR family NAD(P)-dependent oxidoreductase [Clostridiales bacterium]
MNYTVITGASSGIGYASAIAFAKRGKNLILVARRENRLKELENEIAKINPSVKCVLYLADLSSTDRCYKLYHDLKEYELETWINNAGVGVYGKISEHDPQKVEAMLHTNIDALTILSTLYVQEYKDKADTQLINVSSAGGYTVVQNAVAYCATKFYVSAFTEGLAIELKSQKANMQVKVLAPFLTETEFAKIANNEEDFQYKAHYHKYHTSEEMAGFLLQLYDSDKVVGSVRREDFVFSLTDVQCRHAN